MTEMRATAYHEAGHAVVADRLGYGFSTVSIIPDADDATHGRIVFSCPVLASDPNLGLTLRQEERVRNNIVVTLAGGIAEERFCGKPTDEITLGTQSDRDSVTDLAFRMAGSTAECQALLDWLATRADNIVTHRWPQIEAVAAALVERRRLSGTEARLIIRESYAQDVLDRRAAR
jgi:ATP-dependent Zn protease